MSADPGFSPIPGILQELLKVRTAKLSCYFLLSTAELILLSGENHFEDGNLQTIWLNCKVTKKKKIIWAIIWVCTSSNSNRLLNKQQLCVTFHWLTLTPPKLPFDEENDVQQGELVCFGSLLCKIQRALAYNGCQTFPIVTKTSAFSLNSKVRVQLWVPWLKTQPQKLFDSPLACTDWGWRLLIIALFNYCWLVLPLSYCWRLNKPLTRTAHMHTCRCCSIVCFHMIFA